MNAAAEQFPRGIAFGRANMGASGELLAASSNRLAEIDKQLPSLEQSIQDMGKALEQTKEEIAALGDHQAQTGYAAPLAQVDNHGLPLDLSIGHWPRERRLS